jgi:NDP-sugar pyrophosphorylase family protein
MKIDTAVILAAGRGSRLKEVTAARSKALAPIAGKPIIRWVIDSLQAAGISHFIVVGAPHDSELRELCAATPSTTWIAQSKPLGSADALKGVEALVPTRFLVCACDSIIPSQDIATLIEKHSTDSSATLSVIEVAPETPLGARSVVTMQGDLITTIIEKPAPGERLSNLSSLPLYILTHEIFQEISSLTLSTRGEYELPEAFRELLRKGRIVKGVRATERFDLTDKNDLLALNQRFLLELSPTIQAHPSVTIPLTTTLIGPVLIEEGVTIGASTTLGPFVYLERGATVSAHVRLSRTIVLRGASVSTDCDGAVVA